MIRTTVFLIVSVLFHETAISQGRAEFNLLTEFNMLSTGNQANCNSVSFYFKENIGSNPNFSSSLQKSLFYVKMRKAINCEEWDNAAKAYFQLSKNGIRDLKIDGRRTNHPKKWDLKPGMISNSKREIYPFYFGNLKSALSKNDIDAIKLEKSKLNQEFDEATFQLVDLYVRYLEQRNKSYSTRKDTKFKSVDELANDIKVFKQKNTLSTAQLDLFKGAFNNINQFAQKVQGLKTCSGCYGDSKPCSEIASGLVSKQSGRIKEAELVAALSKEKTGERKKCILEEVNKLIGKPYRPIKTVPSVSIVISDYNPGEVYNQQAIGRLYELISALRKYEIEYSDKLTGIKIIGTADNSPYEVTPDYDGFLGVFEKVACPSCRGGEMTLALGDKVDNDELAFLRSKYAQQCFAVFWPHLAAKEVISNDIRQYRTTGGAKRSIEIQVSCSNLKQLADFLESELEESNSFSIYYNEGNMETAEAHEVAAEE